MLRSILGDTLVREARHSRPDPTTAIPFVQAAVFLHNPEVRCDLRPEDRPFVFGLDEETAGAPRPNSLAQWATRVALLPVPGDARDRPRGFTRGAAQPAGGVSDHRDPPGLAPLADPQRTVVVRDPSGDLHWWTWAGAAANATVLAALAGASDPLQRIDNLALRVRRDLGARALRAAIDAAADHPLPPPAVTDEALRGLKFATALPTGLAAQTLAERLADPKGASAVLHEPQDHVMEDSAFRSQLW